MSSKLQPGISHTETLVIHEGLTVPQVSADFTGFEDMPPVFATAYMVGFIEATCVRAIAPWLEEGQGSVGTHVEVSHTAPTPIGLTVAATVKLTRVDGNKLRFAVTCTDDAGPIGGGTHERVIIDRQRFMTRLERKRQQPS